MIRRLNRRKFFYLTSVFTAYLLAIFWVDTAASQNCKPLLLPGKKTLFQRVITNPGANVYVSAGKKAAIVHASVTPFTIYYVYERRQVEGSEWLKVGPSASCDEPESFTYNGNTKIDSFPPTLMSGLFHVADMFQEVQGVHWFNQIRLWKLHLHPRRGHLSFDFLIYIQGLGHLLGILQRPDGEGPAGRGPGGRAHRG